MKHTLLQRLSHELKGSKKGSIFDLLLAAIILLAVAMSLTVAFYLSNSFSTANTLIFGSTFTSVTSALNVLATGIIVIYIAMNMIAIVAAYFVRSHPILAVAAILVLIIEILISNILVNVFQFFIQSSAFASIGNTNMALVVSFFKILPLAVMVLGLVLIYVQFSKPASGNGSSNV